jgi:hypothetical protein
MRRRAIAEGKKTPEQIELLFAKQRDVREGFSPGQHRQKAEKQHLVQRIDDLPLLPGIG